ncbi:nucleotidyltransferase [Herbaspirillum sp. RV1423]|uniref:nucleotidyltransferase domain-containing protein n=1 Tax=Herbaspirillum sp. RV1423 TaxID=1443993 RepID=UPI0004AC64FD|nr:nucleotidyltransferase [Herbaspirillum sp. RV1423]
MQPHLSNAMPLQRTFSNRSSDYFVRMIEDIGRALEPTETQLALLERSYKSTGEFLVNCAEFDGLLVEIHPQGSRELGTITRPVNPDRTGFDIDLVARFDTTAYTKYGYPDGPTRLLRDLFAALQKYADRHGLTLKRWDRCATLEYSDGMCADIAPIIDMPSLIAVHGDLHGWIPDRQLKRYQPTNPRGYNREFNRIATISPIFTGSARLVVAMDSISEKRAEIKPLSNPDDVFGRLLCRFIQVLKLHRDVAFNGSDIAPSSVFLTTLTAAAYEQLAPQPHTNPLDLLSHIVGDMPHHFSASRDWGGEEWTIDNPTAPGDNLASSMNTSERQQAFTQWHSMLEDDLNELFDSIESQAGIDQVARKIESAFGAKASKSVQTAQLERQATARSAGKAPLFTAAGILVPSTARAHTFFGD